MDILDFPAAEICHLIHASSLKPFEGPLNKKKMCAVIGSAYSMCM